MKNAALKATAAKVQTEQVRNDREDRLDRIAKAQEDELRDEIKAAKEARKKKRKEFLKQQERIEAEEADFKSIGRRFRKFCWMCCCY